MKQIEKPNRNPLAKPGRGAERFATQLPVEMGRIHGLTRDISATGIYFESATAQEPGSRVRLSVEVHVRGEKLTLACDGEVVRVDQKDGVLGIAAKLSRSFFSDTVEVIEIATRSPADTH